MNQSDREPENEDHEEMEKAIAEGYARILHDAVYPGGRFQTAAFIKGAGSEFWITEWHQDAKGDWRSHKFLSLPATAITELIALVHASGNSRPLTPV